jgi:hypothetical protein
MRPRAIPLGAEKQANQKKKKWHPFSDQIRPATSNPPDSQHLSTKFLTGTDAKSK